MKVIVKQGTNFVTTNEAVLRLAAQKPGLQPTLVLVPDRFTLQAEQLMLQVKPQLLNTRIVTFSMLYQMLHEELTQGQMSEHQVLDKTSAILYLWTAIRQVQGQLQWFQKSAGYYDFAAQMYNTINQMRSSRVDFTTLENLKQDNAVSQKKYHDINLIYQAYQKILQDKQTDSIGMLEYLLANLAQSKNITQTAVYVCGFTSLSPVRLEVLQTLAKYAASVTIAASQPELLHQLVGYSRDKLTTPAFQPQNYTARCLTERSEAVVVAQKIITLLNQGVPADAIVVLLNEFETTAPVWQEVCQAQGLPVNLDVGQKLSTTAEAKYLRDLLAVLMNDNAENTLAALFNIHSGVNGATLYEWDNTIVKSNLRAAYVPELKQLTATKNWAQLCEQLKTFTTHPKLLELLTTLQDHCQQQAVLQSLTLREFSNLFWSLCTAVKVSQIPTYLDRVLIAPVNEWVPTRVQYLFIANCTEANFPQGQNDDDLLQEADLIGTKITPTPKLQRERNYQQVLLLSSIAEQGLLLSGLREDFQPVVAPQLPQFTVPEAKHQLQPAIAQALFFPEKHLRTTMIEQFYACPYANFIENGLQLRPRETYQMQANTVGLAIHKALEVYFRDHDEAQAIQAGLAKLTYNPAPIRENLIREIKFLIKKLDTLFAGGQFQVGELEYAIKKPLADKLMLTGRIDRVDFAPLKNHQQAVLVLDYKTGSSSSSILKSIALGSKLQLPIYAGALQNRGPIAGMGYLPLKGGYKDDDSWQLKGFVNQDYRDLFPPKLLNPKARIYVSPDKLQQLFTHANQMVNDAVLRLQRGEIKPQAVHENVCQYCAVAQFCAQAGKNCRWEQSKVTWDNFPGGKQ